MFENNAQGEKDLTAARIEELKAAEWFVPIDDDPIEDGARAIRLNTSQTYELVKDATAQAKAIKAELTETINANLLATRKIQRNILRGEDLNSFNTTGDYLIPNGATALALTNYPADARATVGHLSVRSSPTNFSFQRLEIFGAEPQTWVRSNSAVKPVPFPWTEWVPLHNPAPVDLPAPVIEIENNTAPTTKEVTNAHLRNAGLVEDFTRRYRISTGGIAAVALRFDHGLANFRDIVLPLLQEFNFPASQCLNSRRWNTSENGGVTATEVNQWVENGKLEIWNHSATHYNPADRAALEREIVDGLTELREQIPAATIDGWAVPGVTTAAGVTPYMGMGTVTSIAQLTGATAGQLILANHAVATGYIPNTHRRLLDGTVRNGMGHFGLDSATSATPARREIDAAIAAKQGLQFFLHPSVIGSTGKITPAILREIFEYLATKQTAGQLVVLSPYQLTAATL